MKTSCPLIMESFFKDRQCIDIKATVTKHKDIIPHILAAHALSGPQCWGIGKGMVVKVLKAGNTVNVMASKAKVVHEATCFMATCYGVKNKPSTMTALRQRVWKDKTGRANIVSAPKLQSFPPTDESFLLNPMRAHFQACIWTHAAECSPPLLDPLEHGWMQDTVNKTLAPLMLPSDVPPAPDSILKLIKCSYENCGSARCSCVSFGLPCTVFCKCEGCNDCTNGRNTSVQVSTPDDEEPDQFEEPTILC